MAGSPMDAVALVTPSRAESSLPIICGTLDYCRDPKTEEISKWAHEILNRLKPSHTEVNDSGTGFRLWCLGTLPDGADHVTAFGPQMSAGDMPDCAYLNIIHAASDDDEKDKLVGSEPVWNCLALAVAPEGPQCVALEDRTEEIRHIVAKDKFDSLASLPPVFDSPEQITAYYQDQMKVLDPGGYREF
jgi:hypothetical protein